MQKEDFWEILEKISDGSASDEDIALYLEWYNHFESVDRIWDTMQTDPETFRHHLFLRIQENGGLTLAKPVFRLWPRMAIAASLIFCLSVAAFFLTQISPADKVEQRVLTKDLTPGSNKAILTLSNGEQIILNGAKNGKLSIQGDVVINKKKDGQVEYLDNNTPVSKGGIAFNTMTTPRGGQYMVILPDGTKVLLNAASSLKYPTTFNQKNRRVELIGEAYFEVSKYPGKPFLVEVNGQQEIEVLGTHFNVKAYTDDQDIRTTLLEGSIRLTYKTKHVLLKPGEVAINDLKETLAVKPADLETIMAWKNGYFVFNNENIKDIMKQLGRWYDFDVQYEGDMSDIAFQGNYLQSRNLLNLLKIIELTNKVQFKIEGRRVVVTRQKE